MQYRGVNELRELFLSFFEEKGCLRLNSFSLVPHNDTSLLIINSGLQGRRFRRDAGLQPARSASARATLKM